MELIQCVSVLGTQERVTFHSPMGAATEAKFFQEERPEATLFLDGICIQPGRLWMGACSTLARKIRTGRGESV